ncbi:hypothetical protein ACKI1I_18650 [Streptomyces turgidiscabies]|uniref:hypothetical protein n=1 Tax=Streptomyces TaxID=1883 RepID=UPI00076EC32F|nr:MULTISPECIES: hypothetical protein [Streptomyces]MDX3497863.1 hypothetical protein [Streptomyces turgidiscabies]GAQ69769.1 hypothetical protein T45_01500 [Streptomyces turgidiscabies]
MENGVGNRASRFRVWAGIVVLGVGCFLAGDTARRASEALAFGARWWPWILLTVALLNLFGSAMPTGSYIGPLVLGAVALVGLAVSNSVGAQPLEDVALPGVLVVTGAGLALAASHDARTTSWTRFLTSGQVTMPKGSRGTVTVRAVLGDLRADLTRASADDETTVHLTAVAGHVQVTVPRDRTVRVHTSGAVLTHIGETGVDPVEPAEHSRGFTIHVLGVCGAVGIVRV